jgi:hypothetical protein
MFTFIRGFLLSLIFLRFFFLPFLILHYYLLIYQEGKTENATVLTSIKECLQVIFSSTLDMGSLAKGAQMNYEEYALYFFFFFSEIILFYTYEKSLSFTYSFSVTFFLNYSLIFLGAFRTIKKI